MLEDVKKEDVNIIVTKNVNRFDRDTVDALDVLKALKPVQELSLNNMESLTQSENKQQSENIKW